MALLQRQHVSVSSLGKRGWRRRCAHPFVYSRSWQDTGARDAKGLNTGVPTAERQVQRFGGNIYHGSRIY
jgi:hypothetical protein